MRRSRSGGYILGALIVLSWWLCLGPCRLFMRSLRIQRDRRLNVYPAYLNLSRALILCSASERFAERFGHWPTSASELLQLDDLEEEHIRDPFGRPYHYVAFERDRGYGSIISHGRDGMPGRGIRILDHEIEVRFPLQDEGNEIWNRQYQYLEYRMYPPW